ncbi:hypothetical protein MtrunA17_Chr3g0115541 [Medicago truncatula]|uniref:Uncharacterized protein n=1 Tax=Medicago truncatula TaxID=3880 RepID=A0A396IV92_MEDTR|nr:hypothetical protein MtrunA17_Chr3g0115541 [Medicago truncatula]
MGTLMVETHLIAYLRSGTLVMVKFMVMLWSRDTRSASSSKGV